MAALLLTALLSLYRPPAQILRPLEARRADIVAAATDAAEHHGVPLALILVIGFAESHWGLDRASGGSWGSPVDRNHRHVAGGPEQMARDLARSYVVCHDGWQAATRRYRTGICGREPRHGYTAAFAVRLAERLHVRAGLATPALHPTRTLARTP